MNRALLLALVLLSACAERPHSYAAGTASPDEFQRAEAGCRADAMMLPNKIQTNDFTDNCMREKGFYRLH